jgi:hypothetical protein
MSITNVTRSNSIIVTDNALYVEFELYYVDCAMNI